MNTDKKFKIITCEYVELIFSHCIVSTHALLPLQQGCWYNFGLCSLWC